MGPKVPFHPLTSSSTWGESQSGHEKATLPNYTASIFLFLIKLCQSAARRALCLWNMFVALRQVIKAISLPKELGSWLIKIWLLCSFLYLICIFLLGHCKFIGRCFLCPGPVCGTLCSKRRLPTLLKLKGTLNLVLRWNQFPLSMSLFGEVAFLDFFKMQLTKFSDFVYVSLKKKSALCFISHIVGCFLPSFAMKKTRQQFLQK